MGVLAAGASPVGASTWSAPFPSAEDGTDPALIDGRVWWAAPSTYGGPMTLYSRTAHGRGPLSTELQGPGPLNPQITAHDSSLDLNQPTLSMTGKRALVGQQWSNFTTRTSDPPYVAAYDRNTGTRLETLQAPDTVARLVPGSDVAWITPLAGATADATVRQSLADPQLPVASPEVVQEAGRYELRLVGNSKYGVQGYFTSSRNPVFDRPRWATAEVRIRA